MTVAEFLTAEPMWTQRAFARTPDGRSVTPDDPEAVRWCLAGAIHRCRRELETWPQHAVWIRRTGQGLSEWNDAPGRTFAEVQALIIELDL